MYVCQFIPSPVRVGALLMEVPGTPIWGCSTWWAQIPFKSLIFVCADGTITTKAQPSLIMASWAANTPEYAFLNLILPTSEEKIPGTYLEEYSFTLLFAQLACLHHQTEGQKIKKRQETNLKLDTLYCIRIKICSNNFTKHLQYLQYFKAFPVFSIKY